MQFIDLATQQKKIKSQIDSRIQAVLNHGAYIMGPEGKELEGRLAEFVGIKHAIGCASGTDALLMALMAFNVGPGDAILTSPFTFIATAEVISLLGATPIFVDIDPKTFNINPDKLEQALEALKSDDRTLHPLPKASTPNFSSQASSLKPHPVPLTPRGIIAVDLFGLPADYDRITAIARKHNLFLVEDAAQSFGAEYKGQKACAFGQIACTSFFPAKPLGGYGDGGMCFTSDDALAFQLDSIRIHGKGGHKYDHARLGINGRLDTLQAAILLAKFEIFPEEVELRQQIARNYTVLLASKPELVTPVIPSGCQSVWAQYSLLAADEAQRTAFMDRLKTAGIPTAIYYPKPLHLQTAFAGLGYKPGDFPVSEDYAKRIFSLPMHPYLSIDDQEKIARVLSGRNILEL
jgi:dTDP-4-amino-4,6-dideoxygalactose transaminase